MNNFKTENEKQVHTMCGIVRELGPVETRESKWGVLPYQSRKVMVETQEKYPQSAYFVLRGDYLNFPFEVGEKVIVYYNLRAFRTVQGTCGTCLTCWQITDEHGNKRSIADMERVIEEAECEIVK
mgnify:CR=1 FL=1